MKLSASLFAALLCVSCHSHRDTITTSELVATEFRRAISEAFTKITLSENETLSIFHEQPTNFPLSCDSNSLQPSPGARTVTIIRHRQARAAVTESCTTADTAENSRTIKQKTKQTAYGTVAKTPQILSKTHAIIEVIKVFLIVLLLYSLFRFSLNHRS